MMGWQGYDNEGCMPGDRERLLRLRQGMRKRSSPSYTLKEIEILAREYCDNKTTAARLDETLRLSLFIQWLAKREREGLG